MFIQKNNKNKIFDLSQNKNKKVKYLKLKVQ